MTRASLTNSWRRRFLPTTIMILSSSLLLATLRRTVAFSVLSKHSGRSLSTPTTSWSTGRLQHGTMSRVSFSRLLSTSTTSSTTTASNNDDIASMRAGEIKKELESYGISTKSFLEKKDLVAALQKARADGLQPKASASASSASSTSSSSSSSSSTSTGSSSTSTKSRDERIKEEMEKCQSMKATDLKKELEERGISTKSLFEKSEFVKAVAEARVDNISGSSNNKRDESESYAEYKNVEVLTDENAGPRKKQSEQVAQQQQQGRPGGASANPFGGMGGMGGMGGGMGGMGGIADMLKNMGMGGAAAGGANPFGGGANPFGGGAGGNPFGGMGGMGDAMGKAQELAKNPKVRELMAKAQGNPKFMKAMSECMANPAAFAKYERDPEIAYLMAELKKYI